MKLLVTRAAADAAGLVEALRSAGHQVVAVPTIAVIEQAVDPAIVAGRDWVIVTSAAGARRLPAPPPAARVAAVGSATAAELRNRGIEPAFVPSQASGLVLAEELPDAEGARILLARAEQATSDLPAVLRARGARVEEVALYRTVRGPDDQREPLHRALADGVDAGVFASGSAVDGYLALGGNRSLPAIVAGARSAAAARAAGLPILATAGSPAAADIVAALSALEVTT